MPSESNKEVNEFFSALFSSSRKKNLIGFTPSPIHLARDRILAPSVSRNTRDERELSRFLISEATELSPRARAFLALIKRFLSISYVRGWPIDAFNVAARSELDRLITVTRSIV